LRIKAAESGAHPRPGW